MFGLLFIILLAIAIIVYKPKPVGSSLAAPKKISAKLDQLWAIAQESLKDHKYLRAEKALLTILRVDERNASAYNRLGIIYAKQKAYGDAIECFEIAQSLEPSASSLHNVGLIYLETDNLEKAALAFEQAMTMDSEVAARHIAYAKVLQKMGRNEKAIKSFERAVELERSVQSLRILADAYKTSGQVDKANELQSEIDIMLIPKQVQENHRIEAGRKTSAARRTPVLKRQPHKKL